MDHFALIFSNNMHLYETICMLKNKRLRASLINTITTALVMEKLAAQTNIHGAPILNNVNLLLAAALQVCHGAM